MPGPAELALWSAQLASGDRLPPTPGWVHRPLCWESHHLQPLTCWFQATKLVLRKWLHSSIQVLLPPAGATPKCPESPGRWVLAWWLPSRRSTYSSCSVSAAWSISEGQISFLGLRGCAKLAVARFRGARGQGRKSRMEDSFFLCGEGPRKWWFAFWFAPESFPRRKLEAQRTGK